MIKNTGIVKTGFNKYRIEGFNSGIPPTDAILMKKNTIPTKIKQNPIEYMSFLLNSIRFSEVLFKKYLGRIADPIKKAITAISNVITKLVEGALIDKIKNIENKRSTIKGLKRWFFNM